MSSPQSSQVVHENYSLIVVEDWPCKPAIIWDPSMMTTLNGSSFNNNEYWDDGSNNSFGDMMGLPPWIQRYRVKDHSNDSPKEERFWHGISYQTLYRLTSVLAQNLLHKILQELMSREQKHQQQQHHSLDTDGNGSCNNPRLELPLSCRCIPIAVAIPEGFYLPIAISTVYAMNVRRRQQQQEHQYQYQHHHHESKRHLSSCSDQDVAQAIAMVPLEPTEGVDRLKHMIWDAQPFMILTVSAKDQKRLETILLDLASEGAVGPSQQPLTPFVLPLLVDFSSQVHQVLVEENSRLGQGYLPSRLEQSNNNDNYFNCVESLSLLCGCDNHARIEDDAESLQFATPRFHPQNTISHIVYTSGTTGMPKGCISSTRSLHHYIEMKNKVHGISKTSTVLLASSLSFDPCLSDILATLAGFATLALAPRQILKSRLDWALRRLCVTHVLCTPTLWSTLLALEAGQPHEFPHLQLVALGGEPIPPRIRQIWARNSSSDNARDREAGYHGPRLLATYGVTEACVYQTAGEIFKQQHEQAEDALAPRNPGQDVGHPFPGLAVRICREEEPATSVLVDVDSSLEYPDNVGEVILQGEQLDAFSSYLNQEQLSRQKFIHQAVEGTIFYRTGDRGYMDHRTGRLYILGRIASETGMVKFNGIRVELGEIEHALIDNTSDAAVVVDSMVVPEREGGSPTGAIVKLVAHVVLSRECLQEILLKRDSVIPTDGVIVAGPLLILLRQRTRRSCRVIPNAFVILPRIPLSPTGKRDRNGAPSLSSAVSLASLTCDGFPGSNAPLLKEYGKSGAALAEQIVDCLNLSTSQQSALLTSSATFDMLGGDSLAATRIVRALYSQFYGINNTRLLGGAHGILDDERFSAVHLIRAANLGSYVDFLDRETGGVLAAANDNSLNTDGVVVTNNQISDEEITKQDDSVDIKYKANVHDIGNYGDDNENDDDENSVGNVLNDALLEASVLGHVMVAVALLELGADPNFRTADSRKYRLGKTSSRNEQKQVFASSPLHHACSQGQPALVQALLPKGVKTTVPDAKGTFPIHLAAGGSGSRRDLPWNTSKSPSDSATKHLVETTEEHRSHRQWECVRLLLDEAHLPLTMKDGNRQTIVHAAARGGQDYVLERILERWKKQEVEYQKALETAEKEEEKQGKKEEKEKTADSRTGTNKSIVDWRNKWGFLDWRDKWSRTAVHWAILNGHLSTLEILLKAGCSPDPVLPPKSKNSSAAVERPLDLCNRLYGGGTNEVTKETTKTTAAAAATRKNPEQLGMAMKSLLQEYMTKN
ncbi:hypothetical protein ACA910_020051 [Epithemia clementina (nom. ined.)]